VAAFVDQDFSSTLMVLKPGDFDHPKRDDLSTLKSSSMVSCLVFAVNQNYTIENFRLHVLKEKALQASALKVASSDVIDSTYLEISISITCSS
jgi:hypothetical protein